VATASMSVKFPEELSQLKPYNTANQQNMLYISSMSKLNYSVKYGTKK